MDIWIRIDKQHQPSLVASTLYWTIYLEQVGDRWVVTKLTDLHDALYWDPAEKRLAYYRLISNVDGALGNYMAPPGIDDSQWKRNTAAMLPILIDELENIGRRG